MCGKKNNKKRKMDHESDKNEQEGKINGSIYLLFHIIF